MFPSQQRREQKRENQQRESQQEQAEESRQSSAVKQVEGNSDSEEPLAEVNSY